MKSTNNFIFITLEKEFSDKIVGPEGKLELDLMSFKDNIIDQYDEVIYNVNEKRINYGTVIAVPEKLTKDINIYQEHSGSPQPTRYISHEHVEQAPQFLKYDPGTYVAKWKTTADIVPEVKVGDRVYFHFNTIDPENNVQLPDERSFYKLAYQNALCVARHGFAIDTEFLNEKYFPLETSEIIKQRFLKNPRKFIKESALQIKKYCDDHKIDINDNSRIGNLMKPISEIPANIIPIGGNVLIEPCYEDGVVDIGIGGTKGKVSLSGLVTEIGIKPKMLEGVVRHIGKPLRGHVREVEPGDHIVFQKHSDWLVKVEGVDYYCMKQWDIEGKLE